MPKRKPTFNPAQLGFTFDPIPGVIAEGELEGLDKLVASAVSRILSEDPRSRWEIAGSVSGLLADTVSKPMLDAYSAESKEDHNISFARFLALIAETQRYDILNELLKKIGAKVIVGDEILTVELGHVSSQIETLQARKRLLQRVAPTIKGERQR